ncbi:MAG: hypothetical protein GXP46_01840 [Deferribacteres bacterium]|nr:hypothetical protein [Deferribacteres bacterium]
MVEAFNAILKAALNQQFDEFNALAALEVAKNIEIVRKLQEAVLDDGVVVYSEKVDKDGNVIGKELKPHPALLALPKLIADLGLTPQEMMITPRQLARAGREDDGIKSIADLMSAIGTNLKGKKDEDDSSG